MAMHAERLERTVEERIARLESHVEHIQTDVTQMKADIRRLDHSLSELRLAMEKSFSRLTLWGLMLYVALAASLLGVMAKGFGWI
jgi:predicted  nucleic acid-binding Zn-ribbon protein